MVLQSVEKVHERPPCRRPLATSTRGEPGASSFCCAKKSAVSNPATCRRRSRCFAKEASSGAARRLPTRPPRRRNLLARGEPQDPLRCCRESTAPASPRSTSSPVAFFALKVKMGSSTGSADVYSSSPAPSKKIPTTSSPALTGAAAPDLSVSTRRPDAIRRFDTDADAPTWRWSKRATVGARPPSAACAETADTPSRERPPRRFLPGSSSGPIIVRAVRRPNPSALESRSGASNDPRSGNEPRLLRGPRTAGSGRYGRGVPGPRPQARPRSRDQGPSRGLRAGRRRSSRASTARRECSPRSTTRRSRRSTGSRNPARSATS